MTMDDVDNITWLQAQLRKYQELLENEKTTALRVIYRRMTTFYIRKINKIIYGEKQ